MSLRGLTEARATALVALAALAAALGCGGGGSEGPATAGDGPGPSPVRFVDIAPAAGITAVSHAGDLDKRHIVESLGSGAAIGDYDGDGDLDIYVGTQQTRADWLAGTPSAANALYRNEGDGTFTDVAAEAGVDLRAWTGGTYFVDYDGDGDLDLFVTTWGPNALYRNEGDGTFTDVSRTAGVGATARWSASAAFGDLDGDGDLDLWVTNYCEYDRETLRTAGTTMNWRGIEIFEGPQGLVPERDEVYRNEGDGTFTDVTSASGADSVEPKYGLGVVMSDLDDDGDLDVFVANDSLTNDLWVNEGGFRFRDIAMEAGVATNESAMEQAGMGVDAGDYDEDGLMDLFVGNFSHDFNTLHRNLGDMLFLDVTFEAALSDSFPRLAWGAKFHDFDHDGRLDLTIVNGHTYPVVDRHEQLGTTYRQPTTLYRNLGDGRFEDLAARSGPGMAIVQSSRGLAIADLDRDGDIDYVITNQDAPPNVLINEGGESNGSWLALRLRGADSNRHGIGARVEFVAGDRTWIREMNPFGSYESSSDAEIHVGLGALDAVDRVVIRWPSGAVDEHEAVAARRHLVATEGGGLAEQGGAS